MNLANMKRSETTEQIGLINWARANGEYDPIGPVATSKESPFLYWGNNYCYLMAAVRTTDDEDVKAFWEHLEKIAII